MATNKLTAAFVAACRKDPAKHAGKHFDGGGLFLLVKDGGLYWRYKYRLGGKEKAFAIGTLDDYSLAEAREKHGEARKLVAVGSDPVEVRKQVKVAKEVARIAYTSFREVAQEWYDAMIPKDASYSTGDRARRSIRSMNEGFGSKSIDAVTVADLAKVLIKIEKAGTFSTRERVQLCAIKIAGFAVGRGYLKYNPFRDVKFAEAFTNPSAIYEARPAITDVEPFGKLLRDIDRQPCEPEISGITLRLLNLLAVRPGELAKARWENIRWADAMMIVPAAVLKSRTQRKMKKDVRAGKNFEVPLSRQAIAELRRLQKITGQSDYLYPAYSIRTKNLKHPHIRAATINAILLRMGYGEEHCAHGFRSSFSTIMNAERVTVGNRKVLRWPYQDALIEVQLDHNDASTKAVYDRGGHWEDRCELMQAWADRVDEMRREQKLRLVA
jgi:integrase